MQFICVQTPREYFGGLPFIQIKAVSILGGSSMRFVHLGLKIVPVHPYKNTPVRLDRTHLYSLIFCPYGPIDLHASIFGGGFCQF